jgi:signal transduction histidine kinase
MTQTILASILWVMVATLIAVYFITEMITGPLREMSKAAKSFAKGQFDVRVPVRGRDEVAELARAFNNMAQSLENLEKMRNTFMANVSHDLRTPMTTISGFIDNILIGAIPKEEQSYYLGIIKEEVRRLSRLVASLLDISRLQAGDRKFNMQAFDICEQARLILISFEQKIDEKRLNVEFLCDEERMFVSADRDAIYQILYNICDNGVKFASEGGDYRIRIRYDDAVESKRKKVIVSVYNEGEGIAPEDLPYVFERFYKADKSRGLDKSGVGLGMFISKTIIDAHGEKIWVESQHHKSCEFFFTLPIDGNGSAKAP